MELFELIQGIVDLNYELIIKREINGDNTYVSISNRPQCKTNKDLIHKYEHIFTENNNSIYKYALVNAIKTGIITITEMLHNEQPGRTQRCV